MRITIAAAALSLASATFPLSAAAQPFTGTFTVPTDGGGVMTITLSEARDGTVSGALTSDGVTFRVEGRIEGDGVVGTMTGPAGAFPFEAERWENELWVTLYGADDQGRPNYDDYEEIDFFLAGTEAAPAGLPPDPSAQGGAPFGPGSPPQTGGNPLAAGASDPYVGTFTDGSVTLQLQGVAGQYRGQVAVGGQVYPVSASGGPSGLQGVIQASDGSYAMAVQAIDGGLYVVSGGQQYRLFPQQMRDDVDRGFGQPGGRVGGFGPQSGTARPGIGRGRDRVGRAGGAPGQAGAARGRTGRELAPGFTDAHPQVTEWTQFLSGNKLTRMNSYSSGGAGGYSARADVYLCSDGSFSMRDESSVNVDVGGAFGNAGGARSDRGAWYVISNGHVVGLILELQDGQSLEFRMEYRNGETYANGGRVFVTPADVCR